MSSVIRFSIFTVPDLPSFLPEGLYFLSMSRFLLSRCSWFCPNSFFLAGFTETLFPLPFFVDVHTKSVVVLDIYYFSIRVLPQKFIFIINNDIANPAPSCQISQPLVEAFLTMAFKHSCLFLLHAFLFHSSELSIVLALSPWLILALISETNFSPDVMFTLSLNRSICCPCSRMRCICLC